MFKSISVCTIKILKICKKKANYFKIAAKVSAYCNHRKNEYNKHFYYNEFNHNKHLCCCKIKGHNDKYCLSCGFKSVQMQQILLSLQGTKSTYTSVSESTSTTNNSIAASTNTAHSLTGTSLQARHEATSRVRSV